MPEKMTHEQMIEEMYRDMQKLKGDKDMGLLSPFERIFKALDSLPCNNPEAPCPKNGKSTIIGMFMKLSPIERIIMLIVVMVLGGGGSASIVQYLF